MQLQLQSIPKKVNSMLSVIISFCLLLSIFSLQGECGHCTGNNYIYYACDTNHGPPCSGADYCLWEALPPGIYHGGTCINTYVDAFHCNNDPWWVGVTTSRHGLCQTDCSCILYGEPFEDHGGGTMCITGEICIGE